MSNDLLAIVRDGYFMRLNQAWVECLGYTLAELMSKPYAHFVHPGDIERTAEMSAALASGPGEVANFENRYRTKSGGWCWLLWSARSDGRQIYAAAKHISERKQAQLEREHQLSQAEAVARTDPLTGLPNRRAWEEALERELARAQSRGHPIALALLDLDYFKRFNDARGHQAGDELLREAAAAWRHILRATDFVARYGGDEFAVLLPDCSTPQTLSVLDRLVAATPERQTCSIGFAHWDRIESASDLIARADRALYEAKHSGRSRAIRATPSVTLTGGLLLAPEAGTTVR